MQRFLLVSTLLSVAMSATATSSLALEVLADNLAATQFGLQVLNDGRWLAQEFKTTKNSTIEQITLPLVRSGAITAGDFEIAVFTNNGSNIPGSLVGSLSLTNSYTTLTETLTNVVYNVSWNIPTTGSYFLVLRGSGLTGGNIFWEYTDEDCASPPLFTVFPSNYSFYNTTTTTWSTPSIDFPQKIRIVVPNPSTYVLAGLSAITAMLATRAAVSEWDKPPHERQSRTPRLLPGFRSEIAGGLFRRP